MSDIRVLVVDEDEDVLDLTETFLERESDRLEVITERSGEAAMERVADGDVDCVVSDYRMPGMDGMELFEAVRERRSSLPFVLFSAAVDRETVTEAEAAGVTAFIQKGTGTDHYEEIADTIETAVD
jgi:DNA-binding NtrC family response regulator